MVPAAPVAGDLSQGREAGGAPVRRTPHAVDAGATHHGDRVGRRGSRAQQREEVVVHPVLVGPAGIADRLVEDVHLDGQVRTGDVDLGAVQHGTGGQPGRSERLPDEGVQQGDRPRYPEQVRRGAGSPDEAEYPSFAVAHHHIGLGVASVDREVGQSFGHRAHARYAVFAASSLSVSASATSCCPMSGWASIARYTRDRPPWTDAATASSSYADTCAMSPDCSGPTGVMGIGAGPSLSTRQLTSMTASSARNGRCPWLRTFAECTCPSPDSSEPISPTAASE